MTAPYSYAPSVSCALSGHVCWALGTRGWCVRRGGGDVLHTAADRCVTVSGSSRTCPVGPPCAVHLGTDVGATTELSCWCGDALVCLAAPQWGLAARRPVSAGIIEGFKVEKASLQEALGQKEEAERGLVVELESLSQQLQQGTQQLAELREKNAVLLCEKEAAAAEAQEREAGRKGRRLGGSRVSQG